MTHISVGNLTILGSDNGLSPGRHQAIIWTSAGILLIGPLGTNLCDIFLSKLKHFHGRKYGWKCHLRNLNHFVSASMCYDKYQWHVMKTCPVNEKFPLLIFPRVEVIHHPGPINNATIVLSLYPIVYGGPHSKVRDVAVNLLNNGLSTQSIDKLEHQE